MDDSQSRLSLWKRSGLALAVTLGVWFLVSWPLPRYFASGIPASAHRGPADVQRMIPGDHLQFMYYCWLAGDMVAGKTPLFYNLYEFNTGNDRERFDPYAYYIPFSLIYSAGAWLGGRAFGWNLAGFISLWLTYLLTWMLVRRWTQSEWVAAVAALLGIVLPFRWINLFGGSPAGFAMAWIPAIMLGVDLAVSPGRSASAEPGQGNSIKGGILAGAALLLASWGDSHVFFFGTLAVPVWGVVAFTGRTDFQWRQGSSYRRLVMALLPIGLFAAVAFLFPVLMKGLYHAVMGMAPVAHAIGPRTLREVMIFSPDWRGFFGISTFGSATHIYLGVIILVFIAAGWLALIHRSFSDWRMHGRTLILLTLIILVMLTSMILALGPRGPEHGLLFRICRLVIPPYAMIRQPAKIFCLMPSLLAVASAIALTALVQLRSGLSTPKRFAQAGRAWPILVPAVFAGLILWDYAPQSNPTISLLDQKQDAYAAVAADAAAKHVVPRALVLPLWPGDSHYASIYQLYASIYRVRMVNGYNPFIKQGYFENVFRRFESANQGDLAVDQVAALRTQGIRYLLLHENLFPEKVSPFPVTATLKKLLNHPDLELLKRDGSVWAFAVRDAPRPNSPAGAAWTTYLPARRWELEKTRGGPTPGIVSKDDMAGAGGFVTLAAAGSSVQLPMTQVGDLPALRWMVRARGQGTLAGVQIVNERTNAISPLCVAAEDWTWLEIPIVKPAGFMPAGAVLTWQAGRVDLDLALLTAGDWPLLKVGQSATMPAPVFFHAGYIDLPADRVVFRKAIDTGYIVFYGPKLPLAKGTYEMEFQFDSLAAAGAKLGELNIELNDATGAGMAVPVVAGQTARGSWTQSANLPFNLVFLYFAKEDIAVRQVIIRRLK